MSQPLEENRILALSPPLIQGQVDLQTPENYHGGISLETVKDDLHIFVDPWLNMALKDECQMSFDGVIVGTIPVDERNLNTRLKFTVPKAQVTNGAALVFYTVKRVPQEPVSSEPVLNVWIQLTRPAGPDRDSEEGHSGLLYTLSPDPSKGVDAEMARQGIRINIVPYENIAVFDTIRCRWGDQVVTYYPVTKEQIEDPLNNPIFVLFNEGVIREQGNGSRIEVSYQVIDRVGNLPDPNAPWAKVTYVSVNLNISRLPAPTIWVNNQNVTTIDLKDLGTSDAIARAYFTQPDFQVGDKVELSCTGQTPAGVPVTIGPLVHTVGAVPGHFDFKLPNADIRSMVNGKATANYKLLRASVPERQSNDVVVTVTGEVGQLKPPTVVEAPDYKLDPNRHQNGFTVVFDTSTVGANDQVQLEVIGRPGAGSVPPQQKPVAGQSKVQFEIGSPVTGANLQRNVELKYNLIVNGQPTPAQSVTLVNGDLLQSSMPMPKIEGFDGEVLDVGLIRDDTKVLCGVWPFQCLGCPIWLKYVETFAGGGERVKEQFAGTVHDQAVGLSYLAEVEWLRECKAGSTLVVVLKVGLYSGAVESEAVACRVRSYGVKAGLDDLTTFEGYDWNHWALSNHQIPSKITLAKNEYFLESISTPSFHPRTAVSKCFQGIETDSPLEFSFDHRSSTTLDIGLSQNGVAAHSGQVAKSEIWQTTIVRFCSAEFSTPGTLMLAFSAYSPTHIFSIKNLRLRKL
ncbi:hypothetical protein GXB78_04025 [Pseudomonas moraviensis subsp. stanleyae]|uniref:hypothetical protein n=1 Tax=Pseudomonas moraviensis TaxID=321662 RepID=UPI002E37FF78|nr:hypothetical protein [Pseudomonas moraviensis]MED7666380.1 hypothetical protein [Pseudomonas moraviensis subsp. stanleyae]